MIGMVLVTHGRLAVEFLAALEHVVGRQKQIQTVTIGPEDDMDMRRGEIIEAVREVDSGDGVVVLTDMFGGTPSNLAISVMGTCRTEVVAGINLPMLIKLHCVGDSGRRVRWPVGKVSGTPVRVCSLADIRRPPRGVGQTGCAAVARAGQ